MATNSDVMKVIGLFIGASITGGGIGVVAAPKLDPLVNAERLTKIETKQENTDKQLSKIDSSIDKLDAKMDERFNRLSDKIDQLKK